MATGRTCMIAAVFASVVTGTPAPVAAAPVDAPCETPAITIGLVPRPDGSWRATYRFDPAQTRVVLPRATAPYRDTSWTIRTPGVTLDHGDWTALLSDPKGRPFEILRIDVTPHFGETPKDYDPFIAFADGGLLLYTGHFYGVPLPPDAVFEDRPWGAGLPDTLVRYEIDLPPDSHGVVDGRIVDDRILYEDRGEGTYIYIGQTRPLAGDDLVAVIDAALPPWLETDLSTFLPRIFRYYGTRLGFALARRPMVFASYEERPDIKGFSNKGGVLKGLVQVHFAGQQLKTRTPFVEAWSRWFLAHEAAHLWNGQMFTADTQTSARHAWMHEGGAEGMAAVALDNLGLIPAGVLLEKFDRAFQTCTEGLGETPLSGATERKAFDLHYACGLILQDLTDRAIRRLSGGKRDLFDFWRALWSLADGDLYTLEDYFAALAAVAGTDTVAVTRDLVFGSTDDAPATLSAAMIRAGFGFETTADGRVTLADLPPRNRSPVIDP